MITGRDVWPEHGVLYTHTEVIDGFDIVFQAVIEHDMELGDMEDADREKIYADIEAGDLYEFCAVVKCSQLGQLLTYECLGSCIYESYTSFHTDYRDDYYADMVRSAIAGAWGCIRSLDGFNHD